MSKKEKKDNERIQKVLLAHEENYTRVFDISTEEMRMKVYLMLFEERKKEGYYDDVTELGLELPKDPKTILRFIQRRNNYEYERLSEQDVEVVI